MSQVLGTCGLLYFTMLWPFLAWNAFWNLWTIYFFNFQFFFFGGGGGDALNCGYWISRYGVMTVYTLFKSSGVDDMKDCGTNILKGKWFKKNSSWTTQVWSVMVLWRTENCTPNLTSWCPDMNLNPFHSYLKPYCMGRKTVFFSAGI
jgi:hypothetical protein